jgi:hypothetical protein
MSTDAFPPLCTRRGPCPRPTSSRRQRATLVAARLLPAARTLGGFVSTQLRVTVPPFVDGRPDVAVALTDPPPDGHAIAAPVLVVLLAGHATAGPERWLAAGSSAVWVVHAETATEWTRRRVRTRHPDDLLKVPRRPALSLPVGAVTGDGRAGRGSSFRAITLG